MLLVLDIFLVLPYIISFSCSLIFSLIGKDNFFFPLYHFGYLSLYPLYIFYTKKIYISDYQFVLVIRAGQNQEIQKPKNLTSPVSSITFTMPDKITNPTRKMEPLPIMIHHITSVLLTTLDKCTLVNPSLTEITLIVLKI